MNFFRKKDLTVSFATSFWEGDYAILYDTKRLNQLIVNHCYLFSEKLLIINNVTDLEKAVSIAQKRVEEGFFTRFIIAEKKAPQVLDSFQLKKEHFIARDPAVKDEWIYYNALGPLSAIWSVKSDYLLYSTGDVTVEKKVNWIPRALDLLESRRSYKVANLLWNGRIDEARRESYRQKGDFLISKKGFSDQLFLIKVKDFKRPIYSKVRSDSHHYPRGDVFEKRVYSAMRRRGWKRLTFINGSYTHQDNEV